MHTYCAGVAKKCQITEGRSLVTSGVRWEGEDILSHHLASYALLINLCAHHAVSRLVSGHFGSNFTNLKLTRSSFKANTRVVQGDLPTVPFCHVCQSHPSMMSQNGTRCVWPTCLCWGLSCLNSHVFVLEKISTCLFYVEFCRGSVSWHDEVV